MIHMKKDKTFWCIQYCIGFLYKFGRNQAFLKRFVSSMFPDHQLYGLFLCIQALGHQSELFRDHKLIPARQAGRDMLPKVIGGYKIHLIHPSTQHWLTAVFVSKVGEENAICEVTFAPTELNHMPGDCFQGASAQILSC